MKDQLFVCAAQFLLETPALHHARKDVMISDGLDIIFDVEDAGTPDYVVQAYSIPESYIGMKFRNWLTENRHV